ncbi:MAG: tetratricopeptide repeat protein [Deltaproteobacteria bacterium]|nr:tetratricopeptide repeat protein [Deltaproteobacteria bacterium]
MDPVEIADAYVVKADALATSKKYEEAIRIYDAAIEVCPECIEAWTGKAAILKTLGRLQEALECVEGVLEISPSPVAEMLRNNLVEELKRKGVL